MQKTAYEMRISDGSSDVCSSDLDHAQLLGAQLLVGSQLRPLRRKIQQRRPGNNAFLVVVDGAARGSGRRRFVRRCHRSEEHTSELQSLMRISYAVFCLKKKKSYANYNHSTQDKT